MCTLMQSMDTQLCDSCIYNNYTCHCHLITHICVTDWIDAGYGVSDVENLVDCKPSSVMRVASISKPLTMVAIAQLWEQGKLDLDKPIQHYVPSWPDKVFKGQKVFCFNTEILFLFCCRAALPRSSHCIAPCLPTHPSVFLSICPSIQCLLGVPRRQPHRRSGLATLPSVRGDLLCFSHPILV